MAVRDSDDRDRNKPSSTSRQPQRYTVQPRDMTAGEMYTLQELVIEFGSRFALRVTKYKKQQIWEMYAQTDELAKHVEWRLNRQCTQQAHLEYCAEQAMTHPDTQPGDLSPKLPALLYPDALRHVELHLMRNPLKWDMVTGRMPEKKAKY